MSTVHGPDSLLLLLPMACPPNPSCTATPPCTARRSKDMRARGIEPRSFAWEAKIPPQRWGLQHFVGRRWNCAAFARRQALRAGLPLSTPAPATAGIEQPGQTRPQHGRRLQNRAGGTGRDGVWQVGPVGKTVHAGSWLQSSRTVTRDGNTSTGMLRELHRPHAASRKRGGRAHAVARARRRSRRCGGASRGPRTPAKAMWPGEGFCLLP